MSISGRYEDDKQCWHWFRNRPKGLTPVHLRIYDSKFDGDRAQCKRVALRAKAIFMGLPVETGGDDAKRAIQEAISKEWGDSLRRGGQPETCPLLFSTLAFAAAEAAAAHAAAPTVTIKREDVPGRSPGWKITYGHWQQEIVRVSDKDLGGDSECSREVAESLKIFIEGMRNQGQRDVVAAEKERLMTNALAATKPTASQLCAKRHRAKTTCLNHKPPAVTPPVRKKPISKAAEGKARNERIRQMERDGRISKAAAVLTCVDLAELLFKLWVSASAFVS